MAVKIYFLFSQKNRTSSECKCFAGSVNWHCDFHSHRHLPGESVSQLSCATYRPGSTLLPGLMWERCPTVHYRAGSGSLKPREWLLAPHTS